MQRDFRQIDLEMTFRTSKSKRGAEVDMAMNKYNPKKAKKNKVKQEDKNNG